jgi:DNA polymerase III delta prime subunit
LYINASDENNIENVRTKIKSFASNQGFSDLKVVVLDEADFLTLSAQAALRNLMEVCSDHTRFILTCNYVEKLLPALVSRAQSFKVVPPSKGQIGVLTKKILTAEQITHTDADIVNVVNAHFPDIRKVINALQQSSSQGKFKFVSGTGSIDVFSTQLIEMIRTKKQFTSIRQLVADQELRAFDDLYQVLFDNVATFAPKQEAVATIIIAEYVYQSALVVHKEIAFMACIAKLLSEV